MLQSYIHPLILILIMWGSSLITEATLNPCTGLCRCSPDLTLMTCSDSGLVTVPPLPRSTVRLDLDHNHIKLMRNDSLSVEFSRLQVLSICDNGMRRIESGAFSFLSELVEIRLSRNQLTSLPAELFLYNRKLRILDLGSNYFSSIPDNAVIHLHALNTLNLSYNKLISAELGPGFRYTSVLQNVDLSGNNIPSVEGNSFSIMLHWDQSLPFHLNLSYCNIWHIARQAFSPISSLKTLSLEGNQRIMLATLGGALENLPSDTLEEANFSGINITNILEFMSHVKFNKLKVLIMSNNNVERIPKGTFFFLGNLRHLDLSNNKIREIENLAGLTKLEHINLAYNNLNSLDEMMFEGLSDLKSLDISHNVLVELNDEPFFNLFHLNSIDLSCNEIQRVSLNGVLERLEILKLNQNRISDVSFLNRLRLLHTLDISRNAITRLSTQIFSRQQNISIANFSGNAIFNISRDAFQLSNYITVDLSGNRLTNIWNYGWETVQSLHLDGNSIYNIASDSFSSANNLRELYLQNNNLYSIPNGLFANQKRLNVLDLSSNPLGTFIELTDKSSFLDDLTRLQILRLSNAGIKHIPDRLLLNAFSLQQLDISSNLLTDLSTQILRAATKLITLNVAGNQLHEVDVTLLEELKQLREFDVSGNPFHCTCDLVSLCQKLYSGTMNITGLHNRSLYQCSTPGEWRGVPLAVFYSDAGSHCGSYDTVIVAGAVGCGAVVLIVIVGIVVCRYKSWKRHKRPPPVVRKGPVAVNYKFVDERTLTNSSSGSTESSGDCSGRSMYRALPTPRQQPKVPMRQQPIVPEYTRQLLESSRCAKIRERDEYY